MSIQIFTGELPILGEKLAPHRITNEYMPGYHYWAAIYQKRGITAETFMEFSGRFALLCDQTYQGTDANLTVDAAHPNGTIPSDELVQILRDYPGIPISTPADSDQFTRVFAVAKTADLTLKPSTTIPEMPSTFAKVSWNRRNASVLEFYAQGGSTDAGSSFERGFYEKMLFVPGSAPRRGLKAAIGIVAVDGLKTKGRNSSLPANAGFALKKLTKR